MVRRLRACASCVIVLLSITSAGAQDAKQLSPAQLISDLYPAQEDSNQVKQLLHIGTVYMYRPLELKEDLDSALHYLQQALKLSDKLGMIRWKKESLSLLTYCYYEMKDTTSGRASAEALISLYRDDGDQAAEANAYRLLGKYILRHHLNFGDIEYYFGRAREIYTRLGDQKSAIDMYKEIADVHLNQGKLEQSEQELLEVIEMYEKIGYRNLHYTYDLLTAVGTNRGNLNRGLMYGMETIKSMEATGDSASAPTFYYRLGNAHWNLGNTQDAIYWYRKALARNPRISHAIYPLIAEGMIMLGDTQDAIQFLNQSMENAPPVTDLDKSCYARALGLCYHAQGQYEKAEAAFNEMLERIRLYNNPSHLTGATYYCIAEFYADRHRHAEAKAYLEKILELPPGLANVQQQVEVHRLLFHVDSVLGNYLQAIQHFRQYKMLNDSIFTATKSMQIEELQVQYETETRENQILLLQNTAQLQESKLAQARLTKNLTFGGAGVLLLFLAQLFGRNRVKQRINRKLELQQIEINQTNRTLQNLLEEKEWLVREIHHRVKNNLQIVMSLLNTQSAFLEDKTAMNAIRQSQHRIHAISLIHQKLYQSNNVAMIEIGNYIHELVAFLRDTFDAQDDIRFEIHVDPLLLNVTQAVPLGLILNEAISNALKYAFPGDRNGKIRIDLQRSGENQCALSIADNGVGLPLNFQVNTSKSLGLSLMNGLCKQLGGALHVENNNGLTIRLIFQVEPAQKHLHSDTPVSSPEANAGGA